MLADSPQIADRSPVVRSRVTNDSTLLAGVDGRSAIARRYRDLVDAINSDLGGDDAISEGQRQLARRASALSVQCEQIEAVTITIDEDAAEIVQGLLNLEDVLD